MPFIHDHRMSVDCKAKATKKKGKTAVWRRRTPDCHSGTYRSFLSARLRSSCLCGPLVSFSLLVLYPLDPLGCFSPFFLPQFSFGCGVESFQLRPDPVSACRDRWPVPGTGTRSAVLKMVPPSPPTSKTNERHAKPLFPTHQNRHF